MKIKLALIAFAAIVIVAAGCSEMSSVAPVNVLSTVSVGSVNGVPQMYCTALFAGQDIYAGDVCAEVIDYGDTEELRITYITADGWELVEAHLWVGEDLADMPQTRKGNPKVGNFPYHSGDITGQTLYTFSVDLNQFGTEGGADDLCNLMLYAAAHAVVRKANGDGTYQTETGWGDGYRMIQRGNWATYFTMTLSCEVGGGGGGETGETAFAYDCEGNANCFLGIDEDGDGNGDFNRWGWSNGPLGPGTYYFDIYAGAGQCDLSKGTLVGLVTVDYDGSTAIVTYNTCGDYYMDEVHLYVGNEILPRDNQGDFTVAPGQYPYIDDDIATNEYTFTIDGLSGDIYLVAHAVVVGDYSQGDCGERGCVPPGPPCDETAGIVYGVERFTGEVWKIDVAAGTAELSFASITPDPGSATPNGLAFDAANMRMYYCDYRVGTDLYFWDYATGTETVAGTLSHENAAADFYGGKYYYIASYPGTDDLYEVSFNADGTIANEVKLADIADGAHAWTFNGDIAVKDGVLYGWGLCGTHNKYEFFTYDLGTGDFAVYNTTYQQSLQLAFGSNGNILYGHRSGAPGNFYVIDTTDGSVDLTVIYSDGTLYTDTASGQQCQ